MAQEKKTGDLSVLVVTSTESISLEFEDAAFAKLDPPITETPSGKKKKKYKVKDKTEKVYFPGDVLLITKQGQKIDCEVVRKDGRPMPSEPLEEVIVFIKDQP